MALGNNYRVCGVYSPEPRAEVYCVKLNFNISKLVYLHSVICEVVAYERLKTIENFKLLALKVVSVAYERWSLTSGSK